MASLWPPGRARSPNNCWPMAFSRTPVACAGRIIVPSGARRTAPKPPHFTPRAKRVIFLFMHGGPSHLDTFDPKPLLDRDHGKPLPFKRPLTFAEGAIGSLLKSPWQFRRHGQSGLPVSDLFPN